MYAMLTSFELRDGISREAFAEWARGAAASFDQHDGFRGLTVLLDPDGGTGQLITTWDGTEQMRAARASPASERRREALSRLLARPFSQQLLEVVLHHQVGPPEAPARRVATLVVPPLA